jgi:hypothetical protein
MKELSPAEAAAYSKQFNIQEALPAPAAQPKQAGISWQQSAQDMLGNVGQAAQDFGKGVVNSVAFPWTDQTQQEYGPAGFLGDRLPEIGIGVAGAAMAPFTGGATIPAAATLIGAYELARREDELKDANVQQTPLNTTLPAFTTGVAGAVPFVQAGGALPTIAANAALGYGTDVVNRAVERAAAGQDVMAEGLLNPGLSTALGAGIPISLAAASKIPGVARRLTGRASAVDELAQERYLPDTPMTTDPSGIKVSSGAMPENMQIPEGMRYEPTARRGMGGLVPDIEYGPSGEVRLLRGNVQQTHNLLPEVSSAPPSVVTDAGNLPIEARQRQLNAEMQQLQQYEPSPMPATPTADALSAQQQQAMDAWVQKAQQGVAEIRANQQLSAAQKQQAEAAWIQQVQQGMQAIKANQVGKATQQQQAMDAWVAQSVQEAKMASLMKQEAEDKLVAQMRQVIAEERKKKGPVVRAAQSGHLNTGALLDLPGAIAKSATEWVANHMPLVPLATRAFMDSAHVLGDDAIQAAAVAMGNDSLLRPELMTVLAHMEDKIGSKIKGTPVDAAVKKALMENEVGTLHRGQVDLAVQYGIPDDVAAYVKELDVLRETLPTVIGFKGNKNYYAQEYANTENLPFVIDPKTGAVVTSPKESAIKSSAFFKRGAPKAARANETAGESMLKHIDRLIRQASFAPVEWDGAKYVLRPDAPINKVLPLLQSENPSLRQAAETMVDVGLGNPMDVGTRELLRASARWQAAVLQGRVNVVGNNIPLFFGASDLPVSTLSKSLVGVGFTKNGRHFANHMAGVTDVDAAQQIAELYGKQLTRPENPIIAAEKYIRAAYLYAAVTEELKARGLTYEQVFKKGSLVRRALQGESTQQLRNSYATRNEIMAEAHRKLSQVSPSWSTYTARPVMRTPAAAAFPFMRAGLNEAERVLWLAKNQRAGLLRYIGFKYLFGGGQALADPRVYNTLITTFPDQADKFQAMRDAPTPANALDATWLNFTDIPVGPQFNQPLIQAPGMMTWFDKANTATAVLTDEDADLVRKMQAGVHALADPVALTASLTPAAAPATYLMARLTDAAVETHGAGGVTQKQGYPVVRSGFDAYANVFLKGSKQKQAIDNYTADRQALSKLAKDLPKEDLTAKVQQLADKYPELAAQDAKAKGDAVISALVKELRKGKVKGDNALPSKKLVQEAKNYYTKMQTTEDPGQRQQVQSQYERLKQRIKDKYPKYNENKLKTRIKGD